VGESREESLLLFFIFEELDRRRFSWMEFRFSISGLAGRPVL
jgi:hypothetical protein